MKMKIPLIWVLASDSEWTWYDRLNMTTTQRWTAGSQRKEWVDAHQPMLRVEGITLRVSTTDCERRIRDSEEKGTVV